MATKKYKQLILALMFVLMIFVAQSTFAFEVNYVPIPGVGTPENCIPGECLGQLVSYWFTFGIYIAGALAAISFAIGAIGLISPNPSSHNDAKDRMKGSVLGLVLILSAWVILRTINPSFITPALTPLPGVAGIFYAKGEELAPAPLAEENVASSLAHKEGYNQILYKCTEGGEKIAPTLLIWKFPEPNLESGNNLTGGGIRVVRKKCGELEAIESAGSFKMAFETPGIYYFLGEYCTGYMSGANTTTQDRIDESFIGKIKSAKIVNGTKNEDYYGVIFHNTPDASKGSDCTGPILADGCKNLSEYLLSGDFATFSAEIFKRRGDEDYLTAGDGVWFYSDVNGWDSGNKSGVFHATSEKIGRAFSAKTETFTFDYTGVNSEQAITCSYFPACKDIDPENYGGLDCCNCASPKDWSIGEDSKCGGSIKVGGNYLVTLYTKYTDKDGKKNSFCQSFKKDTANLSTENSARPNGEAIDTIVIIPLK
jgi:hypothetical protein